MTVEEFESIPNKIAAVEKQIAAMKLQHEKDILAKEEEIIGLRLQQMGLALGQKRVCSDALRSGLTEHWKDLEIIVIVGLNDSNHGVYIEHDDENNRSFCTVKDLSALLECEVVTSS